MNKVVGNISPIEKISGNITYGNGTGQNVHLYDGVTEVVPNFIGTVLPTANKLVTEDITVSPIQVSRTSNSSGGTTVYIGGNI